MTAVGKLNPNSTIKEYINGVSDSENALTVLEQIATKYELSQLLQQKNRAEFERIAGANMEADALHMLIEYANTDPAHVLNVETDYTTDLDKWQDEVQDTPAWLEWRVLVSLNWGKTSDEYNNSQPYHNDIYPYL